MKIKGLKVPIFTTVWSLIMFVSILVTIEAHGLDTIVKMTNPLDTWQVSKSNALIAMFFMLTAMIFILFAFVYRNNIKMMMIPVSCPLFISLVTAFYQGIRFGNWNTFTGNSFREFSYLLVIVIFALVVWEKYNNKSILTIVSIALMILALAYFLAGLNPFVIGNNIYFSKLIFFIAYCAIILTYSIGMKKED